MRPTGSDNAVPPAREVAPACPVFLRWVASGAAVLENRVMLEPTRISAGRILIVMPNWLGDAVMATPFLRSIRRLYSHAHIAALGRPLVQPVLSGLELVNEPLAYWVGGSGKPDARKTAAMLARKNFDLAILLPNSFRSSWILWRAGIPRRLGYNREYRRALLTDTINPVGRSPDEIQLQLARGAVRKLMLRQTVPDDAVLCPDGRTGWQLESAGPVIALTPSPLAVWRARRHNFQPLSAIDYYLRLAGYLGGQTDDRTMLLGMTPAETAEANSVLAQAAISSMDSYMLLFPGANFGASKCWPSERFAAVARQVADAAGPFNGRVLIASAPAEKPLVDALLASLSGANDIRRRVVALYTLNAGRGVSLGALKELVRRANLVLCNDTGPRHFAVAMGTPLVTLFGPTDPRWAETFYNQEIQLSLPVPCGPCQLKKCPTDHRCMNLLDVPMVMAAIERQWRQLRPSAEPGGDH